MVYFKANLDKCSTHSWEGNFVADFESRRNERASEWMLNTLYLSTALKELNFSPNIDLFATFVSYRRNPQAASIDAFTLTWSSMMFYAFPPFSLIGSALSKIKADRARGVCVLPNMPTQPWYPKALSMLEHPPLHLQPSKNLLQLPSHPDEVHPLYKKLPLMICLIREYLDNEDNTMVHKKTHFPLNV